LSAPVPDLFVNPDKTEAWNNNIVKRKLPNMYIEKCVQLTVCNHWVWIVVKNFKQLSNKTLKNPCISGTKRLNFMMDAP